MSFISGFFSNSSSNSSSTNVDPKIYVLPCLQELKNQSKGIGRLVGLEYEQQPSKWDGKNVSPLFSGALYGSANASDYFDRYWSGKDTNIQVEVSKNNLLTIPSFSNYGFTSECKKLSCSQKWTMYTQFLCDQFNKMDQNNKMDQKNNNVALLVTHHNRMRDTDLNQGLLPFKSKKIDTGDGEEKSAYANNFCLKIQVTPGQPPSFEVFFPGFPDKGDFKGDCSGGTTPDMTPSSSFSENPQENPGMYLSGGGGSYYYECNTNNINTDVISEGIKNGLTNSTKPMTIYVIRHGNALHNKPVNASDSFTTDQKRLDSSLTPLGMYQAIILAGKFKEANAFANSNVILCCSFLQRTQLTGLLLLEASGILNGSMQSGLDTMKSQALTRFQNINFNSDKFNGYPPLLNNEKEITNFKDYYTDLGGWFGRQQAGKRKGRKTHKIRKGKKTNKKSKSQKKRRTRRRR